MGRKGVGKLAPFGVCRYVEVISSGGDEVDAPGGGKGYRTAHLILDRDAIMSDTDEAYEPKTGNLDETIQPKSGTILRLSGFGYRHVPAMDDFERQLAQRFGLSSGSWQIKLADNTKQPTPAQERSVGQFQLGSIEENTTIKLELLAGKDGSNGKEDYRAVGPEGPMPDVSPGFAHDGAFYPATGWVGYSEKPYKDDLMAGVRIYCRGKIAAQTNIFNMKAGFTGEYDVRSYLVGELTADWLDTARI